ncbi:endo-1,4-beta-xylanase [Pelagicoccus sp. SDUM812002]|uniref:endo-1,4-beta-xylanase n=1 Tax=Pelagicoccus sp. SDUM812002 TaxID=3041266 RepID=UPI00280FEF93|nr:endo-1,4-beta-xylanase [Pelagicoccus sp. SDUM812002]MDQ8186998.1 endo-1,4-beta-xylanase [Pelagicoccus sp. SDUM812002]
MRSTIITRQGLLLTLILGTVLHAHAKTAVPDGGVSIIPSNAITSFFWPGNFNNSPVASAEVVSADHPDFNEALRVTVSNPAGQYWNGALQINSTAAVSQGDVIFVRAFFRSIESKDESGVGFATVFPQGPEPDYTKYFQREITAGKNWVEYMFPFEMSENRPIGTLSLQIGAGAGSKTQIWEIGGIEMLNFGNSLEVADLPITRPTYAGRDPDASWRIAAAERIEQHRKGNFSIQVLDTDGSPLPDAEVSVEFVRHAYHFGSVIVAHRLFSDAPDDILYREKFLDLFNQSGPENDLKWAPWAGEWGNLYSSQQTINAMQWLQDRGIYTRGHVMVWPSKRNLPNLMQEYLPEGDPANADPAAKQVVLDHIDDIASRTEAVIEEWDVLNEPYDNFYLMEAFGDEVMLDWFERARANLPQHGLFINDYSILSGGGRDFAHQQHFEDTIEYLVSNDAPVTGIGMQGHFSASPTGIELVYSILERFHNAFPELDIRVTEFDVSTEDEEMQADYTRDFLTIMFSHPATLGVQAWGFWENAHWRPAAAMYTADWREKPNAVAWRELTQETWWNDFSGTTNSNGEFSAHGFYGDYQVTVTQGSKVQQFPLPLRKGGANQVQVLLGIPHPRTPSDLRASSAATGPVVEFPDTEEGAYYLEASEDLKKWSTLHKIKATSADVLYRMPLPDDGVVFYRLAKD